MILSPRGRVFILLSRGHFDIRVWMLDWDFGFGFSDLKGPNSESRPKSKMIALTRLNGQRFVINAEKIRYLEQTPDTVVCCESGEKLMVKETLDEVIRRAIEYARAIRRPVTE